MESLCEECKQTAQFSCKCNNKAYCRKHRKTHREKLPDAKHRFIAIVDPNAIEIKINTRTGTPTGNKTKKAKTKGKKGKQPKRSASAFATPKGGNSLSNTFLIKDPNKEETKQSKQPKNEETKKYERKDFTKEEVKMLLTTELQRLRNLRKEVNSKLAAEAQKHIKEIVENRSEMSKTISQRFLECENSFKESITLVESAKSSKGLGCANSLLSRITENPDLNKTIVEIHSSVKEISLSLSNTLKFEIKLARLDSVIRVKDFYEHNLAKIHETLKPLFVEIINEKHFSKKKFKLNKVSLKKEGAKQLAMLLNLYPKLTVLSLTECEIGPEGMKKLSHSIGNLRSLEKLRLPTNALGSQGGRFLAPAIKCLKSLLFLNLSHNGLGPEGVRFISLVIKDLPELKEITLNTNNLGQGSVKHLTGSLVFAKKLELIKLEDNLFGTEDKRQLRQIVPRNCKLEI